MTSTARRRDGADGPADQGPRRSRALRWAVAVVLALAFGVLLALIAIRQPAVATWLANVLLARLTPLPRASARVAEARGDWIRWIELRGLRVTRGDTLLAGVDTLRARYRLDALVLGRLEVDALALHGVRVTADARDTTRRAVKRPALTFEQVLQGRFYTGPPLHVARLDLADATIGGHADAPDTGFRITRLAARASDVRLGRGFAFRIDSLAGGLHPGGGRRDSASFEVAAALAGGRAELGRLRFLGEASDVQGHGALSIGGRDTLQSAGLTLSARPLSLADVAGFLPGLPLAGELSADIDLRGTRSDRLSGRAHARLEHGRAGALELDACSLDATMDEGRLQGSASARLAGATLSLQASGTPLGVEPGYSVRLNADRLPARLPGLAWWDALAARADAALELNVNGVGYSPANVEITGRATGEAGTLALDGRIRSGPAVEWEVRSLSIHQLDVARVAGGSGASALSGRLTGSGTFARDGRASAVAELRIEPSTLGAVHIHSADVRGRVDGAQVSGTLHVQTDAGALDVGSFAASTAPRGAAHVRDARFRDLDLSRLLGQPALASRLDGALAVEAHDLAKLGAAPGGPQPLFGAGPSADARIELAPSTFRGQPIRSGAARVSLARGTARADVQLATGAGTARIVADARPFDRPASARLESLRFEGVDLAAWTGIATLRSELAGELTGAFHARAGADARARASAALQLERSRLGRARLDGGELRASADEDHAVIDGSVRTAGSALALHGEVSSRARRTQGTGTCTVPFELLAALAGRDSLPARGAVVADFRFAGDPAGALRADGSATGSGGVGRVRFDTVAAAFRLERGLLRIDTLLARANVGTARGGGSVALDPASGARRTSFSLHLEAADVSPLRELLHVDTLALASGSFDVTLSGADSVRTIAAAGSLRSLVWNDLRLSGAELTSAAVLGRTWRPSDASLELSLRQLQGLPIPVRDGVARARLEGSRVSFLAAASTDLRSNVRVRGRAAFDTAGTLVTLDSLAVHADTVDWRLASPSRLAWSATRFSIDDLDVRSRSGRLTARGTIDRRGEQDLDVALHRVGIPGLGRWVGRPDLTGYVEGGLTLRGAAARPRADGRLTLALFTAGEPAGSVATRFTWAERRARVDGAFSTPRADSLSWSAQLPLAASLAVPDPSARVTAKPAFEGPVHVRVLARHFPLAALGPLLDPHAVGTPSGTLDVDARLEGDERALAGTGTLAIAGGVLPLPILGVTYRDLALDAEFQGDRLLIRHAGAASGNGKLEAGGEVRFASVTRVEQRVHVKTRKFLFADSPDLKAMATCELDVTGTLAAPVVKGSVTVGNSSFTFTQSDLTATAAGAEVQLTPADVRMMEETFGYVAPRAPELPVQLYDASDLELAIKLERDNWIRQRVPPKMSVALTGDFRLRKRPHAEPELFGKIEPIPNRGYVQQFARSFDIVGGEVLLNGKMPDHAVSIHAQFKPESGVESDNSNEVVVRLDVEGTPEHLRLTLSSEPPMSETEIVNFIATGHSSVASPSATTSTTNSSLLRDIGMSQLTGPAETAAQEAVGLDVLEVRYDPLRGATLVAGRYVDPQLYVGFRSPLDYSQNTSPNTSNSTVNSTAFEVEYAISRWLVFNLQGETAKVRSFIRARRAY